MVGWQVSTDWVFRHLDHCRVLQQVESSEESRRRVMTEQHATFRDARWEWGRWRVLRGGSFVSVRGSRGELCCSMLSM
jgi:hypothetical protein